MRRDSLVQLPPALMRPRASGRARFVMGIDGGATKTLAAVLDLEDHALHLAQRGPSNQDSVGTELAVGALLEAAAEALERAGTPQGELGAAVRGGTSTATHVRPARAEAGVVVNDVVGAWATATGAGPGIGVIAGTGSNVLGVGADGRAWRAGGWGHLLEEEGSGYWLGIQSIKTTLRDREASGPETALSEAVERFFDAPSV